MISLFIFFGIVPLCAPDTVPDRINLLTENLEQNAFASKLQTCQKFEINNMNSMYNLEFILCILILVFPL